MTDDEIKHLFGKCNDLQSCANYWIDGGMRLVEYLHGQGMKYRDIYAIMENKRKEVA